jgi:hypothetical protein
MSARGEKREKKIESSGIARGLAQGDNLTEKNYLSRNPRKRRPGPTQGCRHVYDYYFYDDEEEERF